MASDKGSSGLHGSEDDIHEATQEQKAPNVSRRYSREANKRMIVFAAIVASVVFGIGQYATVRISPIEDPSKLAFVNTIDGTKVIKHAETLISNGNSEFVYEHSRAKAREYIRDQLKAGGIPGDQIIWHKFEYQKKEASGRNITTTTWTGINIVVWTNSTEIPLNPNQKIRIYGAHYDTVNWGENATAGAHDNLAGAGLLVELAINAYRFKQSKPATAQEIPYMFVFFDHEEPGALGSKTFIDFYKVGKIVHNIAYFVDIDAIGYRGATPILQTYPYEDKGTTHFSPRWLVSLMLQAAFYATEDGIMVGHPGFFSSLGYQGTRYHLMAISYLSDDGPFTWAGVPSLLFTDYDVFWRETNPQYHTIADQPQNLDADILQTSGSILSYFMLVTEDPTVLVAGPAPTPNTLSAKVISGFTKFVQSSVIVGYEQYVAIGPFSFGFLELSSISLLMLFIIYHSSFQAYRELCVACITNHADMNVIAKYVNHRLLFFHLVFLTIAVFIDTVCAFIMIALGFFALSTLHKRNLNIVLGIVCCAFCAHFLMMDLTQMSDFGKRTSKATEVKIGFLTLIYAVHTLGVLMYGADYHIKSKLKSHAD